MGGYRVRSEIQAVRWAGEFVGFPGEAGSFTSGGTPSNLTALTAARGARLRLPPQRKLARGPARALLLGRGALLGRSRRGLARDRLRPGPGAPDRREPPAPPRGGRRTRSTDQAAGVDPGRGRRDRRHDAHRRRRSDRRARGHLRARNVWLHIDEAWGCRPPSRRASPHLFKGVDRADSVSIDAHKWLYLPKACSIVLDRSGADVRAALGHEEAYLPHDRLEAPRRRHHARVLAAVPGAQALARAPRARRRRVPRRDRAEPPPGAAPTTAPARSQEPSRSQQAAALGRPVPPPPAGVEDLDAPTTPSSFAGSQEGGPSSGSRRRIDGRTYLRPCLVKLPHGDDDVVAFVDHVEGTGRADRG